MNSVTLFCAALLLTICVAGSIALIVVTPTVLVVALPLLPEALLMSATADDDEDQVTVDVRSTVLPSV